MHLAGFIISIFPTHPCVRTQRNNMGQKTIVFDMFFKLSLVSRNICSHYTLSLCCLVEFQTFVCVFLTKIRNACCSLQVFIRKLGTECTFKFLNQKCLFTKMSAVESCEHFLRESFDGVYILSDHP